MLQTSYYHAPLATFLTTPRDTILGELSRSHHFALEGTQRDAWLVQIDLLQQALAGLDSGTIFFEFAIPRMGKRADVVLLLAGIVFVIEFKVGSDTFDRAAIDQVHDYALDLKNFHRGSHDVPILPILIATRAGNVGPVDIQWAVDQVAAPICCAHDHLLPVIEAALGNAVPRVLEAAAWAVSGYLPTPTIIEAAQALYQDHAVEEIARSDAGAKNLNTTTACIRAVIQDARASRSKTICFVTGVPGSGKTLAGLNIATASVQQDDAEKAVFLSGNGPLVTVLREALARDQCARTGCKKQDAAREVASFVQNIHHFRDEALRDLNAPPERIVIFDEAQRAWDRDQASKFMQAKRGQVGFDQSEPEFLISVMDRHEDWCVIICLVGGGQEINTGEAGLSEWMSALRVHYPNWRVHLSDRLSDPHYGLQASAEALTANEQVTWQPDLHLGVAMRSFRAEALSEFVGHLLDNRADLAAQAYTKIQDRYPIVLTRNIDEARAWLRQQARGSERYGIMASSGALRLRPEGLNVRAKIDPANWFLNGPDDVRSAFYLEEVATEFDVQGLEVDWACVSWDGDLRYQKDAWTAHAFKGTNWQKVNAPERQTYLRNAYRVILTRARQGMVIFVPEGEALDRTRPPAFYDQTFQFLQACGLVCLS
ncbi:DUF2075 domain-containing protein [Hyphomonas polymorpha]|uniref:DUF2075 domain-containing protein n=1 Tax=Hyphomonas polymorpha TaxID=74319 RepID=UPI00054E2D5C|nr:DUF2075 domain-containing protein [Hyphomonas polymorpha]